VPRIDPVKPGEQQCRAIADVLVGIGEQGHQGIDRRIAKRDDRFLGIAAEPPQRDSRIANLRHAFGQRRTRHMSRGVVGPGLRRRPAREQAGNKHGQDNARSRHDPSNAPSLACEGLAEQGSGCPATCSATMLGTGSFAGNGCTRVRQQAKKGLSLFSRCVSSHDDSAGLGAKRMDATQGQGVGTAGTAPWLPQFPRGVSGAILSGVWVMLLALAVIMPVAGLFSLASLDRNVWQPIERIGLLVYQDGSRVRLNPMGAEAARSGIRSGDMPVAIDGKPVRNAQFLDPAITARLCRPRRFDGAPDHALARRHAQGPFPDPHMASCRRVLRDRRLVAFGGCGPPAGHGGPAVAVPHAGRRPGIPPALSPACRRPAVLHLPDRRQRQLRRRADVWRDRPAVAALRA
jgi:hypothetical protein